MDDDLLEFEEMTFDPDTARRWRRLAARHQMTDSELLEYLLDEFDEAAPRAPGLVVEYEVTCHCPVTIAGAIRLLE